MAGLTSGYQDIYFVPNVITKRFKKLSAIQNSISVAVIGKSTIFFDCTYLVHVKPQIKNNGSPPSFTSKWMTLNARYNNKRATLISLGKLFD